MSRVQFFPESYKCSECETVQKHYVWSDEIETKEHKCTCCDEVLKPSDLVFEEPKESFNIGGKMTGQQVRSERKARSTEHFKKDIMPTIGGKDRKHFEKKYGKS